MKKDPQIFKRRRRESNWCLWEIEKTKAEDEGTRSKVHFAHRVLRYVDVLCDGTIDKEAKGAW